MSKVINISNLKPGKTYKVSVRGNLSNGKKTTWSQNYTITTPSDTAPATPAVPTVSVIGPQKVLVTHDNKDSTGANLSDTNKLFEVYMSSTNSNSSGTLIGTIPAQKPSSGFNTVSTIAVNGPTTDATKYFYVKAVNFSGQRSASSATTSSVAITTFDSAYIGSLTADKIATGTLQANTSISVGSSTPIVLKANDASPYGQIYIGTGTYANSNTPFYVDSSGKFSLGNQLFFSSGTLSIGIVDTAQSTANSAVAKTVNLDSLGRIINGISIQNTGNIYSQKTAYLDDTNGWFLGWNSAGTYPVINIGNTANYIKWTPSSTLQINGTMQSGTDSNNIKIYTQAFGNSIIWTNTGDITTQTGWQNQIQANAYGPRINLSSSGVLEITGAYRENSNNQAYLNLNPSHESYTKTTVSSASGNGSVITYTCTSHGFVAGATVTVSGFTPSGYNITDSTILSVTTNNFTVSGTQTGSSSGTGSAKATIRGYISTKSAPSGGKLAGFWSSNSGLRNIEVVYTSGTPSDLYGNDGDIVFTWT